MAKKSAEGSATSKTRKDVAPKPATTPSHEEIALRAYHIYLQRNGSPGNAFEDWKRAEQESVRPARGDALQAALEVDDPAVVLEPPGAC